MARFILKTIALAITVMAAALFIGGGKPVADTIRELGFTNGAAFWAIVLLAVASLITLIARKYRDYRAMYGQHHHGGHS